MAQLLGGTLLLVRTFWLQKVENPIQTSLSKKKKKKAIRLWNPDVQGLRVGSRGSDDDDGTQSLSSFRLYILLGSFHAHRLQLFQDSILPAVYLLRERVAPP